MAGLLTDKGDTLKVVYAHNVDPTQALAGEVSRALTGDEATLITLG